LFFVHVQAGVEFFFVYFSFGGLICFVSRTEYYSGKDKDTSLDGNLVNSSKNFCISVFFFTSPYTFVSSSEFSLWASQGREPINAWFTAQLGILDSVRVYFLYVSGK
jgi:hypothetical protein